MRLSGFGRKLPEGLGDRASYPDSWLFPIEERSLKQLRRDAARADGRGMRRGVFAKVGDSNMLAFNSFFGLGCREPVWDRHTELEAVMNRYRQIELPPGADIDFTHCPDSSERQPWKTPRTPTASSGP